MGLVKILVVEDEFVVSEKLANSLKSWGYTVTGTVASAEEALKSVETSTPDLIIMDIKLNGGLDGIDLAILLHKKNNIPLIYLTGYSEKDLFTRAKYTKPSSYLSKPFNDNDLHHAIELALFNDPGLTVPEGMTGKPLGNLNDRIYIKDTKNRFNKIEVPDILWISAEGAYSKIVTVNGNFMATGNLKTLESKIGNPTIARVHRSFLVNLARVERIIGKTELVINTGQENGKEEYANNQINKKNIPIGPEYRESIHKLLHTI